MLKLENVVWNFDESYFKRLGNVRLFTANKEELLEEIRFRLATQLKTRIFFLNAHCFNIAQKNNNYLKNLNDADFVLNDGIGVELGARAFDLLLKENLNGTDLTPEVLRIINQEKMSLYLLGGRPGVAELAAEKISEEFSDIILSGTWHGFFENPSDVLADINKVKPDLLLVGMGVPVQENWISQHFNELDATIIMAVGAYLDFASGRIERAPEIVRKMRMEWVYRFLLEPKRMFRRYMIGNIVFFLNIIKLARARHTEP